MAGISYHQRQREMAFRVWRESGQNIAETLRRLKDEHGLTVARPTLYDWMRKDDWKDRAARLNEQESTIRDDVEGGRENTLKGLLRVKKRYDEHFASTVNGVPDTNVTRAYASLCETIERIQKGLEARQAEPEPGDHPDPAEVINRIIGMEYGEP